MQDDSIMKYNDIKDNAIQCKSMPCIATHLYYGLSIDFREAEPQREHSNNNIFLGDCILFVLISHDYVMRLHQIIMTHRIN